MYDINNEYIMYMINMKQFPHIVRPFYRTYRTQCGKKSLFISSAMIRDRERGSTLDLGDILGIDPLHKVSFLHLPHHAPN